MKKIGFITFQLMVLLAFGQEKNRYQFAHTYFGFEAEVLPQSGEINTLDISNNIVSKKLPHTISNRLIFGGTHFWNRADFYVSFPLINLTTHGTKNARISNGILTGFKLFPFQLQPNAFRPFVGIGFAGAQYQQKTAVGNGSELNNRQWYYEGGFSYRKGGSKIFEIGIRYFDDKTFNYYISRELRQQVELANFSFMISYKKLFDFSQSYSKPKMQEYLKKAYKALEKEKALSTFSFGIGFSATIPLEKIEHSEQIDFLNQETTQNGNIELGIGYYLHQLDGAVRLSYRPLKQKETAYGYEMQLLTHSLVAEGFKFLGDYHGFVPFLGPYFGFNNYRLTERDYNRTAVDFKSTKLAYGLVFGWDIRLSEVDYLILRTNLRYTPNFNYKRGGLKYTNEQLEFNFIQLVYYPERKKHTKNL